MVRKRRIRGILPTGLSLLAFGCAPGGEPAAEAVAATGGGEAFSPAVAPATSVNAIMVGLVDHAAHQIWDLGTEEMAPRTDEDWEEVAHYAIQLIASGTAITAGGTGALDANWVTQPQWQEYAQRVTDAGLAAWDAATRRDLAAVLAAGDDLIETCEACHQEYKPAVPTEGILHPHY